VFLQRVAVRGSVWQCFYGVWQSVAVCCSGLQSVVVCCAFRKHTIFCVYGGGVFFVIGKHSGSVLQHVAVCCSVLQCVAVRCSAL